MSRRLLHRIWEILLPIALIFGAGCYAATVGIHLLTELRISLYGEEAPAQIVKVEMMERDDGNNSWTVDFINYSFRSPEGFLLTGVNEANSYETKRLIGKPDSKGTYTIATVEYLPRNPEINRLKGWGYGGYGPPGGAASFALRFGIHLAVLLAAMGYACHLLFERPRRQAQRVHSGAA